MKREDYLKQVIYAVKNLKNAHDKLNELWALDSSNELDLNDYLYTMYPFEKSFDELNRDIAYWVEDSVTRLQRHRDFFNDVDGRISSDRTAL